MAEPAATADGWSVRPEGEPDHVQHETLLGALVFALAAATPAVAQERAVFLFARGGGYNGLSNLTDAGTSDFKKVGFDVGGGVGVQVHRNVSVRGDFTFARNELRDNQIATGTKLNRFFYDAALQLQYPTASGIEPYLFAGAGAVTLHEVGTSGQYKTKAAGTFGLGFNYRIPNTQFGLFAEGKSWLYQLSGMQGTLAGVNKMTAVSRFPAEIAERRTRSWDRVVLHAEPSDFLTLERRVP